MTKFTAIPPEIRNKIYKLVLIKNKPIIITSPRKKYQLKQKYPNSASLLMVNKQIYAEAKFLFYSLNEFVIGNEHWGSTIFANLHGLQAFISRVPKDCLEHIRKVHFEGCLYLKEYSYLTRRSNAKQLLTMSRTMLKYFKGVESLEIELFAGDGHQELFPSSFDAEYLGGISKAIEMLFSLPNLKESKARQKGNVKVQSLVEGVLLKLPESNVSRLVVH
jgi:hypothetical protein